MNDLVQIKEVQEYELMKRQAAAFYQSGMFSDLKSHAQALVKVMVGKELGVPPFASISGIHMVMGKPVPGANLMATLIAQHPTYTYRVRELTNEVCHIEFYDSKNKKISKESSLGVASFTIKEAETAGLLAKKDSIWLKYPKDMLFARALTRGARHFTPGIFGGVAVYTAEELGVEIDEDDRIVATIIEEVKEIHEEPTLTIEELSSSGHSLLEPGSDEAIIEEIKKTNVLSQGFR
jgi:hypothetical protein